MSLNRLQVLLLASAAILALSPACKRDRDLGPPKAVAVRADGAIDLAATTFNLRYENGGERGVRSWRKRLPQVVRLVRTMDPDVMGVQEALHGQAADLWASLPDYEFFGIGRDDGRRAGEYSGVFYRRSRFEADASDGGTFWLSDAPETPGSHTWGNTIPRVAVWIRLIDRATGRGFYVFNTHWDHQHQGSRERAARLLAGRIDARRNAAEPVVLLGDFNATEANPAVAFLGGRRVELAGTTQQWPRGLIDTYQLLHPGERLRRTLHFWSGSHDGLVKVDHILVSKGAKVVSSAIAQDHEPLASDHFPVSARFLFPAD